MSTLLRTALLTATLALTAASPPARAADGDPQALFAEANRHYLAGEHALAATLYGRVLTEFQLDDPALYANLGNAYFRLGAYGSAIFCYRRGLRLEPEGEVATRLQANLETTRRVLERRYRTGSEGKQFIYAEPGGFLYAVTHVIAPAPLAAIFLLLWVAALAALALRRLRRGQRGLLATATGTGIAALLFGALLFGQVYADRAFRLGVVLEDNVLLREGRHADARGTDIPEGMEVRILESDDAWARIALANGREGWVPVAAVKQI